MARLRLNNLSSYVSNITVTLASGTGSTTATFSSAPSVIGMPTVANPDILVLAVEPGTANQEIIWVTAYSSGATTATVTRNAEVTANAAGAITHTSAQWAHVATALYDLKNASFRLDALRLWR